MHGCLSRSLDIVVNGISFIPAYEPCPTNVLPAVGNCIRS
jgi:hypothetical protein